MSEIFFIKLNLDSLGNQLLALETDAERSDWLLGFQVGAGGSAPRESWSTHKRDGWEFGAHARREAMESAEKASRAGRASADSRRKKYGSADPRTNTSGTPFRTPFRTPFKQPSEQDREQQTEQGCEHDVNQLSAISYQLSAISEQPEKHPPAPQGGRRERKAYDPGEFDHMIPEGLALSGEFVTTWHLWVEDRRTRRKAITEEAARLQLKKLETEAKTAEVAIAWIRNSIEKGYTGLFAPPSQPKSSPPKPDPWNPGFATKVYERSPNGLF